MERKIEIPDCLIKQESRDWYVRRVQEHYKKVDRFYNERRDDYALPIGMFCDTGAQSCALQEALLIQSPREMKEGSLEDIVQLGIR